MNELIKKILLLTGLLFSSISLIFMVYNIVEGNFIYGLIFGLLTIYFAFVIILIIFINHIKILEELTIF